MIAHVRGRLVEKAPGEAIVDVGGVGFRVSVSLTTFCRLPESGAAVELLTATVVRENAFDLFGFASADERRLFNLLRGVSGIGPRLALSILSGIEPAELAEVLREGHLNRLLAIPGVGRRTAERILVELKGKGGEAAGGTGASLEEEAVRALVTLGYKQAEARKAVVASRGGTVEPIEVLIKRSLTQLA
jgi:Holliday junction DNA helicase RuvA